MTVVKRGLSVGVPHLPARLAGGTIAIAGREDRATRGRDPSARRGARTEKGEAALVSPPPSRDWPWGDKSQGARGTESPVHLEPSWLKTLSGVR